jgi:hypothetical protein
MNMAIFTMLAWEKELEILRQTHVPWGDDLKSVEPTLRPRRKSLKRIFGWIRRQRPCECSSLAIVIDRMQ